MIGQIQTWRKLTQFVWFHVENGDWIAICMIGTKSWYQVSSVFLLDSNSSKIFIEQKKFLTSGGKRKLRRNKLRFFPHQELIKDIQKNLSWSFIFLPFFDSSETFNFCPNFQLKKIKKCKISKNRKFVQNSNFVFLSSFLQKSFNNTNWRQKPEKNVIMGMLKFGKLVEFWCSLWLFE